MTDGKIVYQPSRQANPHKCNLPLLKSGLDSLYPEGTVWKCDCGAYYRVNESSSYRIAFWTKISKRKGRKYERKARPEVIAVGGKFMPGVVPPKVKGTPPPGPPGR